MISDKIVSELLTLKGYQELSPPQKLAVEAEILENNENYIRWRYIEGLHDGSSEVIYIPTEAGIPIMEAGRFNAVVA